MAFRDSLKIIPLIINTSDSEEGDKVRKVTSSHKQTIVQHEVQDGSGDDDSFDIKPPQTYAKADLNSHHGDKRRRHCKKHESSRRDFHQIHYDRSDHQDGRHWVSADSNKRGDRDMENRSNCYRDDCGRDKDKDFKKDIEVQEITEVKNTRLIKDIREKREVRTSKSQEGRHLPQEWNMDWGKNRFFWIKHQREQIEKLFWLYKEDHSEQHMQEKLQKKEVMQQEKESHTASFKSPKKNHDAPSNTEEKKEKFHIITPVPINEKRMNCGGRKVNVKKTGQMSDEDDFDTESSSRDIDSEGPICSVTDEDDLDTESSSGDIDSEGPICSVMDEDDDRKDTSEEEVEETKSAGEKKADLIIKTSPPAELVGPSTPKPLTYLPAIQGCRSTEEFHFLNRIEEGTYGVVYRAQHKKTNEIVALKRLKMEKEKEGFPITSLREINTSLKAQHPNVVSVREIVVGYTMDEIYIVMDYVEHDLKSLIEIMTRPFLIGEVKTLMMQLLSAVAYLHDNWILHRDLKTSNILLSRKGILKVGDFGLAREYGSPLKSYTPRVVTLWYRAPELLLGAKQYSTPIDIWSVGCIFGELVTMSVLFRGKSESDQINEIFRNLGTPNNKNWPGYNELPLVKTMHIIQYAFNSIRGRFPYTFTDLGFDLLNRFLTYNPTNRITAEEAKSHEYFNEPPKPVSPNEFPMWPTKSEHGHHKASLKPSKLPYDRKQYARQMTKSDDGLMIAGFHMSRAQQKYSAKVPDFNLKF